jgi:hypothetical protein
MRQAIRRNPARMPVARGDSTPAPVGGWNARDALSDMPREDAVVLDNYFPETQGVKLRKGYASHATGLTGAVESLMAYSPPGSGATLFAANNSAVYDVTSSGAVGAAEFSSLASIRFQHTMFGNSAGNFLYIVNGSDAPRYYSGTWTTPTITGSGLTASNLIHVNAHKRRLFFIEKDTLSFWYFPVETISGTITEFRLDGLCTLGGYLMAMGTWTRDSGDGIDDLAVFITSKGEVIIYQGTDPGSASDWALVGVFRIGEPVGRRCMFKVGAELVIITRDGFMPISRAIASARTSERAAISDKIVNAVTDAVRDHGAKFGWQPVLYPNGNYALFNVPIVEGSKTHQYVVNTTTAAWCRFTGQNGFCWEVFEDELYFGGTAEVFKADTGEADDDSDINGEAKTAFAYLGSRGQQKRFTMVRPVIRTTGSVGFALNVDVDFSDNSPTSTPTYVEATGSAWDTSPWDTSTWGSAPIVQKEWQSADGVGYSASLHLKSASQNLTMEWFATEWVYETGGFL